MDGFVVHGTIDGAQAQIAWTPDGGFSGDTGRLDAAVARGDEIPATPTGPFLVAGKTPAEVALLTAVASLDRVDRVEGGEDAQARLRDLCAVPDGASA